MKKLVFCAALALAPFAATAADGFSTVDEFQSDFEKATPCKNIDGRRVWKGEKAFYVQAYVFATQKFKAFSEDSASVVDRDEQPAEIVELYEKACR